MAPNETKLFQIDHPNNGKSKKEISMVMTAKMPTREAYLNIKSAIRRRDPRSAVGLANTLPHDEVEELWRHLREWSVTETPVSDVETPALVRALYDNYSLDPLQAFLERAIIVVSHANKSTI
jgi:hypothetical protein